MKWLVLFTISALCAGARAGEAVTQMQAASDRVAECHSRNSDCRQEESAWLAQIANVRDQALAESVPMGKARKKPVHRPRPRPRSVSEEARRAGIPFFPDWCR